MNFVFLYMLKMTSSESESDAVWKRKSAPTRQEVPESSYWASPPKTKRQKTDQAPRSRGKAKACLIADCGFQVANLHKHLKFQHMPAFLSREMNDKELEACVAHVERLVLLLDLANIEALLGFVRAHKLYHVDPVEMTPIDLKNMNLLGEKFGEEKATDMQLRKIDKKSQLIHWTVVIRITAKLSNEQRANLEIMFPTPARLNKLDVRKRYIFGDSIVRNLEEHLVIKVPVVCAPGVTMCKPVKEKWLARLWVPVLEALLANTKAPVPPHLIFHLGTNNVSNSRRKAAAEVEREAKELCAKIWKFLKFTRITFSAVLPRAAADKDAVYQVNHKLRELAQSDDRLSFVDFGSQLLSDQNYGRDQIHLSSAGKARLGTCFSEYLMTPI